MDKQRTLYLIAYDVSDPRRLHRVCRYLTGYKVGGQKSVFEIWVTDTELREIRGELGHMMSQEKDRLHILALEPRMKVRCKGLARSFEQKFFCIV